MVFRRTNPIGITLTVISLVFVSLFYSTTMAHADFDDSFPESFKIAVRGGTTKDIPPECIPLLGLAKQYHGRTIAINKEINKINAEGRKIQSLPNPADDYAVDEYNTKVYAINSKIDYVNKVLKPKAARYFEEFKKTAHRYYRLVKMRILRENSKRLLLIF